MRFLLRWTLFLGCCAITAHATISPVRERIRRGHTKRVATEEVQRPKPGTHLGVDLSGLKLLYDEGKHTAKNRPRAPSVEVGIAAVPMPLESLVCSKRTEGTSSGTSNDCMKQWSKHARCVNGTMVVTTDTYVATTVGVSTDLDALPTARSFSETLALPSADDHNSENDAWALHVIVFYCEDLPYTYGDIVATGSVELYYQNGDDDEEASGKGAGRRYLLSPPLWRLVRWNCVLWVCYAGLIGRNVLGWVRWRQRQKEEPPRRLPHVGKMWWVQSLILVSLVARGLARSAALVGFRVWDATGRYSGVLGLFETLLDVASHAVLGLFCLATLVNPVVAFSLPDSCLRWGLRLTAASFLACYYSFDGLSRWFLAQEGLVWFYPDWYNAGNIFYACAIGTAGWQLFEMLVVFRRLRRTVTLLASLKACPSLRRMVPRYFRVRQWYMAWLGTTIVLLAVGGIYPVRTLHSWVGFWVAREVVHLAFVAYLVLGIHPLTPEDPLVGVHALVVVPAGHAFDILWMSGEGLEDDENENDDTGSNENEDGIDVYQIGPRRGWRIIYGAQTLRNLESHISEMTEMTNTLDTPDPMTNNQDTIDDGEDVLRRRTDRDVESQPLL